jgi:hypothetical protein
VLAIALSQGCVKDLAPGRFTRQKRKFGGFLPLNLFTRGTSPLGSGFLDTAVDGGEGPSGIGRLAFPALFG